ncbi:MAG: CPBP family intramembrane glutamic endopeptidase [Terrisporobacter sp.]
MKNTDFFKFENANDDFPFYNGKPSSITLMQSIFIIIMSIVSIVIFDVAGDRLPSFIGPFINIIIPLGSFMLVTKSGWTKLFRKIHLKDIKLIIIVLIFNLIATVIMGSLTSKFAGAGANPAAGFIQHNSLNENIIFYIKVIPMLLGEELITIIPFLAILNISTRYLKFSRKKGIIIAWIMSALIFGAIHLPTYDWNIVQAILAISIVRLILTYPYIKTKNIWVSCCLHVLNDWILFLPSLLM